MAESQFLDYALRYASWGWAVFPLQGKTPFPKTHGHKDATIDYKQIRAWWRKWPNANIGIACDDRTGPIVVDVDMPKSDKEKPGQTLLRELAIPETSIVTTSPGKMHLYFAEPLEDVTIGRIIRVTRDKVKYSMDILGSGGYVVAPPSIHPETGKPYHWSRTNRIKPLPPAIIHLIEEHRHGAFVPTKVAPPLPTIIGEGRA
jgi:hypothetical protein